MPQIDNATANAAARVGSAIKLAHVTPIVADTRLPPTIDHGCASGLAGTANRRTAEAPMGATSSGMFAAGPSSRNIEPPVKAMPSSAPRHERARSCHFTVTGTGTKLASQRRARERDKIEGAECTGKGPHLSGKTLITRIPCGHDYISI